METCLHFQNTGIPWRYMRDTNMKLILSFLLFIICLIHSYFRVKNSRRGDERVLAFFHPYCNNGGGGERVLWLMISALLQHSIISKHLRIVVYTGDIGIEKERLIENAEKHFNIAISPESRNRLEFKYIKSRTLLEAKWYPFMTMFFQSVGSIVVGLECLLLCCPDIFCDSTGAAFCYPFVALLGGCKVVSYVHYPIISSDMLKLVREQRPSYNNDSAIAKNVTVSKLKLIYYQVFAWLYRFVGSFSSLVMANSSWTIGHISSLWELEEGTSTSSSLAMNWFPQQQHRRLVKVFPPCNTTHLQAIELSGRFTGPGAVPRESLELVPSVPCRRGTYREQLILSVGQFRPEKDHRLQIRSFSKFAKSSLGARFPAARLVLLGSCRNEEDAKLIEGLRSLADSHGVKDRVDFVINAPYSVLLEFLRRSAVGLHTMWNEHFGISVVEQMAAGAIMIAHKSGGPLMDIVVTCAGQDTGFLASNEEEYSSAMAQALLLACSEDRQRDYTAMQTTARQACERFADEAFIDSVTKEFSKVIR